MSSGEGCQISSSTNPTYPDPPVNQRQRSLSLPRTKYERDFLGILAELKASDLSSLKLPPPLSTSESDETSPSAHNRSPTRENSPIGDQAPVGDQSPAGGQYPAPRKRVFYRKVDKAGNIIEISDSEKAANESGWETVSTLDDGASTSTDEEGRRPPQERRVDKPARASEHGPDSEKQSESEESLSYKPRPSNDTEARPAEHEDDPASRQESKDQNTQTQDSEHNSADPSAEDEATPEKPSQANNTEHAEREKKPTLDESAFEAENPSPTGPSDHGSDLSDAWSSEREYRTRKDEGTRQSNKALQGEEDQECRPSGPAPSTAPPRSPSPFNLSSDSTEGGHGLPPGEEVPENILSGSTAEGLSRCPSGCLCGCPNRSCRCASVCACPCGHASRSSDINSDRSPSPESSGPGGSESAKELSRVDTFRAQLRNWRQQQPYLATFALIQGICTLIPLALFLLSLVATAFLSAGVLTVSGVFLGPFLLLTVALGCVIWIIWLGSTHLWSFLRFLNPANIVGWFRGLWRN